MTSTNSPYPLPFMRVILQNEVFHQMSKFVSVGFVNLGLSLIIFNLVSARLQAVLPPKLAALAVLAATSIAFVITTSVAFLLNSRITFRGRHVDLAAYCRYGLVSLAGFLFTNILTLAFLYLIALLRHESVAQMMQVFKPGKNIAYLAAVGMVFFWNFFMSRHWVFPTAAAAKTVVQTAR